MDNLITGINMIVLIISIITIIYLQFKLKWALLKLYDIQETLKNQEELLDSIDNNIYKLTIQKEEELKLIEKKKEL